MLRLNILKYLVISISKSISIFTSLTAAKKNTTLDESLNYNEHFAGAYVFQRSIR